MREVVDYPVTFGSGSFRHFEDCVPGTSASPFKPYEEVINAGSEVRHVKGCGSGNAAGARGGRDFIKATEISVPSPAREAMRIAL